MSENKLKNGYGISYGPVRFHPYKPASQQFKHGKKGRWQEMDEYGSWDNCAEPHVVVADIPATNITLAAPKLLEALERSLDAHQMIWIGDGGSPQAFEKLPSTIEARAAISSARGK